ncbi:roadblock/LC7 domain-containing protein [Kitasatospora sp. NPDC006697]|uniref:roadblock/LC7 domain-containing protein n=1 Tax=Kitasatospora sp. NPDC006697 TaxID=3364020 RepID=UPI0036AD9D7F
MPPPSSELAAVPDILGELMELRSRIPQLTGGLVATVDGLVVAHDTDGVEPDGVAALTAAALGVGARLAEATGQGTFLELLTRGEHGYIATYAAGASTVLTLFAGPEVNVGLLQFEARRSGPRIAQFTDAALRRSAGA